ncbi:hypothetical protein DFH09DRAFT_1284927 [Mycena vulgaris]|nr:hypothetical protein DFH09DRAFT_1284927 [Mycena vulgaris]
MTSTAPTRPARNRQVSSRIANDDNSVGLSAAAQNLLSAKPIIDLVKKIAKLTLFLPETVPLATEEDDIPRRIFELEGEEGTVASTFNRRVDILFGEHVRDSDGRLKYVRRGNLGMDCVVKYLESIHWESAKIPLDLAQGKLARIADELDYLCGGDWEPTKPAGKIADLRPSFTKDAGSRGVENLNSGPSLHPCGTLTSVRGPVKEVFSVVWTRSSISLDYEWFWTVLRRVMCLAGGIRYQYLKTSLLRDSLLEIWGGQDKPCLIRDNNKRTQRATRPLP